MVGMSNSTDGPVPELLRAMDSHLALLPGKTYFARLPSPGVAQLNKILRVTIQNPDAVGNAKEGVIKIKRVSNTEVLAEFVRAHAFPFPAREEERAHAPRRSLDSRPVHDSRPPARTAFGGRGPRVPSGPAAPMRINRIQKEHVGTRVALSGRIEKVQQTGGPTLFLVFDGSGTMNCKAFIGAGKRAFPEIDANMLVHLSATILEREGVLEGEIDSMASASKEELEALIARMQADVDKRVQPLQRPFLVESEILDKLRPEFEKAVRLIKRAIVDNRPIVLKHHADADGYSSAIALERAILPLVFDQHSDEKALWHYYVRTPSKSPYYDYYDATKDISMALTDVAKFNDKLPLIVIVDTGSGPENELPIQLVRLFGCPVIVVDHHHFESDPITPIIDVHINPHFVGSQTDFSAGMLCVEIARLLTEKAERIDYIPALAGLADRINSKELNAYLELAENLGYSREFLVQLGTVIDFEAWNFKFSESRELVDLLFGSDPKKQRELVELIHPKVQAMMDAQLRISKKFVKTAKVGNTIVATIDLDASSQMGVYPPAGKATGNLHDWLKRDHPGKAVVTAGYGPDFLTIRASDNAPFAVSAFVANCIAKFPDTGIEGGGHEHAGSLKFVPGVRDQVLAELEEFVKTKSV